MARINIEDQFWDETFDLVMAVGDRDKALGNLLRFMRFAQARYKEGRVVTEADFLEQKFLPELKGNFAQPVDGGYMVKGAAKHFGWLQTRVEAGRKGGLARNEGKRQAATEREYRKRANNILNQAVKSGEVIRPEKCSSCGEQGRINGHHEDYSKPLDVVWLCDNCHAAKHSGSKIINKKHKQAQASTSNLQQAQASFSYSPSSSCSSSCETPSDSFSKNPSGCSGGVLQTPPPPPEGTGTVRAGSRQKSAGKTLGARIFDAYAAEFRKRYANREPVRNAMINKMCTQIGERLGDDGVEVAKFYVWHNHNFYVTKSHALKLLLGDCETLHTQWSLGRQTTSQDGHSAEKKQGVVNAFAHLLPGGGQK